jgi:hypothetical protein
LPSINFRRPAFDFRHHRTKTHQTGAPKITQGAAVTKKVISNATLSDKSPPDSRSAASAEITSRLCCNPRNRLLPAVTSTPNKLGDGAIAALWSQPAATAKTQRRQRRQIHSLQGIRRMINELRN